VKPQKAVENLDEILRKEGEERGKYNMHATATATAAGASGAANGAANHGAAGRGVTAPAGDHRGGVDESKDHSKGGATEEEDEKEEEGPGGSLGADPSPFVLARYSKNIQCSDSSDESDDAEDEEEKGNSANSRRAVSLQSSQRQQQQQSRALIHTRADSSASVTNLLSTAHVNDDKKDGTTKAKASSSSSTGGASSSTSSSTQTSGTSRIRITPKPSFNDKNRGDISGGSSATFHREPGSVAAAAAAATDAAATEASAGSAAKSPAKGGRRGPRGAQQLDSYSSHQQQQFVDVDAPAWFSGPPILWRRGRLGGDARVIMWAPCGGRSGARNFHGDK
jgi:cellulose 1,4-beta-cellobiosidase